MACLTVIYLLLVDLAVISTTYLAEPGTAQQYEESRGGSEGKRLIVFLAAATCPIYPLVNIQKAIENGHLVR